MTTEHNGQWYAVTEAGIPLAQASEIFEEVDYGLLRQLSPDEREDLSTCLEEDDPDGLLGDGVEGMISAEEFFEPEKWRAKVQKDSDRAVEVVRELVRVVGGKEVSREAVNIPAEEAALAKAPLPGTIEGCLAEVQAIEAERDRLEKAMMAWPRCLSMRRLALRDARIEALLEAAAGLGDVSARLRLGRTAYEKYDDQKAARHLAGLKDCDATARAILAVMRLEGRLPAGVSAPMVHSREPWPLAVPSRHAFFLCREAFRRAGWYTAPDTAAEPICDDDAETPIPPEAVEWLRAAACAGYPFAQWCLALLYRDGNGVERSLERALSWTALAAAAGRPEALHALSEGNLAAFGEAHLPSWCSVEPRNPLWVDVSHETPSLDLLVVAAQRHHPAALLDLAEREEEANPTHAKTLLREADARGQAESKARLAELAEKTHDWPEAIRCREALLAQSPTDCLAAYWLARDLRAAGRTDEAVDAFRHCLDLCDNSDDFNRDYVRRNARRALRALGQTPPNKH